LLVKLCQDGDQRAFEALFKQHRRPVLNIILRFNIDGESAQDLIQEVFIQVFKSIQGFKGESEFSTWLYRMTVNKCIDYLRKNKKDKNTLRIDEKFYQSEEGPVAGYNPEKEYEHKMIQRMILEAAGKVHIKSRKVFVLFSLGNLKIDKIAEILKIPVGTVKFRLFEARNQIRQILIGQGVQHVL